MTLHIHNLITHTDALPATQRTPEALKLRQQGANYSSKLENLALKALTALLNGPNGSRAAANLRAKMARVDCGEVLVGWHMVDEGLLERTGQLTQRLNGEVIFIDDEVLCILRFLGLSAESVTSQLLAK